MAAIATLPGNSEPPCCSGPMDDGHYAADDYYHDPYDDYAHYFDDDF